MTEEIVALYGDDGGVIGSAPRSRVRAGNLQHGATAVLVYNARGEIYVHRRTVTKDVYPGLRDFCAGGVLTAGEAPDDGAVREAFEELGVHGVPLTRLGERRYADEHTRYICFQYACTFDGPIVWQPEEVVSGEWMTPAALLDEVRRRGGDFVPDSVALGLDLVDRFGRSTCR